MSTAYTTGRWTPSPGSEDAFVSAWMAFAGWVSGMPGAGRLRLVRDLHEPGRSQLRRLGEHRPGQGVEGVAGVQGADGAGPPARRRLPPHRARAGGDRGGRVSGLACGRGRRLMRVVILGAGFGGLELATMLSSVDQGGVLDVALIEGRRIRLRLLQARRDVPANDPRRRPSAVSRLRQARRPPAA